MHVFCVLCPGQLPDRIGRLFILIPARLISKVTIKLFFELVRYTKALLIISTGLADMTNSIGWKDVYSNKAKATPCEADCVNCMQPLFLARTPLFRTATAHGGRTKQGQVYTFLSISRQLKCRFASCQCHNCSSNVVSWQQGSPSSGSGKQPRRCRSSVKHADLAEHCTSLRAVP